MPGTEPTPAHFALWELLLVFVPVMAWAIHQWWQWRRWKRGQPRDSEPPPPSAEP